MLCRDLEGFLGVLEVDILILRCTYKDVDCSEMDSEKKQEYISITDMHYGFPEQGTSPV